MPEKVRKRTRPGSANSRRINTLYTRQKGTETAFTGEYEDTENPRNHKCVCCGPALVSLETRTTSGSGWAQGFYALRAKRRRKRRMDHKARKCDGTDSHSAALADRPPRGPRLEDGPQPTDAVLH